MLLIQIRRPITKVTTVLLCLLLAVMAVLPTALAPQRLLSAASGITLESSVQVAFPASMTFFVKAQSDANIVRLRLHYKVDRVNYAQVVSEGWAQFKPSLSVNSQWLWDMRKGGLPPVTQVAYWWTAMDTAGERAETQPSTVSFDDDRYKWQSITTEAVTLLWYQGNRSFADVLMTAAQQGLQRLENDTGAVPKRHVRIYIYGTTQDLQGALLFPREWTGGVTFQAFDVIVIGVPQNQLDWGKRAVAHELTHWIVGQLTFNDYGAGLPTWLDEGLATYGEGPITPDNQALLGNAIKQDNLIAVRSLSSPFSADPQLAYLSYAESYSIVAFLIQNYGRDKMVQLLGVFHQGSTYDDALKQVYGFDQDGLNSLWRQSIGVKTTFASQIQLLRPSLWSSYRVVAPEGSLS